MFKNFHALRKSTVGVPFLLLFLNLPWVHAEDSGSMQTPKCPAGAKWVGIAPPDGFAQGCERPDGSKDGPFVIWHKNGQESDEGNYKEGKLNGPYSSWYENGAKKKQGEYQDEQLTGVWKRWSESGQLLDSGAWKAGVPTGTWTFWYGNGNKKSEGDFADGKEEGQWNYWYENGKTKERGNFHEGNKICGWTVWDETTGVESERIENQDPSCAALAKKLSWHLGRFRLGQFGLFQNSGGKSYSGFLTWNPEVQILPWLSAGVGTGGSILTGGSLGYFLMLEYVLTLTVGGLPILPQVLVGVEGGAQTWIGHSGTYPVVGLNVSWKFEQPVFHILERVLVGYSTLIAPDVTHEVRIGIGIDWFGTHAL